MWLSTFHSFCLEKILRTVNADIQPLDDIDHRILLRRNIADLSLVHFWRLAEPAEFLQDFVTFSRAARMSSSRTNDYQRNTSPMLRQYDCKVSLDADALQGCGRRNRRKAGGARPRLPGERALAARAESPDISARNCSGRGSARETTKLARRPMQPVPLHPEWTNFKTPTWRSSNFCGSLLARHRTQYRWAITIRRSTAFEALLMEASPRFSSAFAAQMLRLRQRPREAFWCLSRKTIAPKPHPQYRRRGDSKQRTVAVAAFC